MLLLHRITPPLFTLPSTLPQHAFKLSRHGDTNVKWLFLAFRLGRNAQHPSMGSTFVLINACSPSTQSSFLSALPCSSPDILDALASSFLNQRSSRIFPSFPPKQATNTCLAGFRGTRSKYQEGKGSVTRQSEDLEAAALLSCRKVPCHTMSCYSSQLRPERCLKKEHWKGRAYKAGGKGRATAMCV